MLNGESDLVGDLLPNQKVGSKTQVSTSNLIEVCPDDDDSHLSDWNHVQGSVNPPDTIRQGLKVTRR